MQRSVAAAPGVPPVTLLNIADVELFVSVTVPAVNWLPLLVVVSENAANVPNAARAPVTPTTTSVARPLRAVVIWGLPSMARRARSGAQRSAFRPVIGNTARSL